MILNCFSNFKLMEYINLIIAAISSGGLSSIATWFVSKRKRNNDFLTDLQKSINTLTDSYTKTLAELIKVRHANSILMFEIDSLKNQQTVMVDQNKQLLKQVGTLQEEVMQLKEENSNLLKKINELKKYLNNRKNENGN